MGTINSLSDFLYQRRTEIEGQQIIIQQLLADVDPAVLERPGMEIVLYVARHDSLTGDDIARASFFNLVRNESGGDSYVVEPMLNAESGAEELFFVNRRETSLSNFVWFVGQQASARFDQLVSAQVINKMPSTSEPAEDATPPIEGPAGLLPRGKVIFQEP